MKTTKRNMTNSTAMRFFLFLALATLLSIIPFQDGMAFSHSTHYAEAKLINQTGHGTVYLSTSASTETGQTGSSNPGVQNGYSYIDWNCGASSSNDKAKNVYAHGTPAQGYYWAGWAGSSTATSYTATSTAKSATKPSSTNSSNPTTTTIYGFFKPVEISSVADPSPASFAPTNATTTCTDYTGSVVFTTSHASNGDDFKAATITNKSGNGTYTITGQTYSDNQVTVSYKFVGNGTYNTRNNSAKITLTSYGGENSLSSAAITANYPAISIPSGDPGEELNPATPSTTVSASTTFSTLYADDASDFTMPTSFTSVTGGGTWTVNSTSYSGTDYETGEGTVTINYTFDPEEQVGSHSAQLTLTAAGGATKTITLTANVEAASTQDASVTTGGVTTKYDTWAEALTAANSNEGSTLTLLRSVEGLTSTQTITTSITIDLNRYTLSGTLSAAGGLLKLNTAGKTLTITDSRSGGTISVSGNIAGRISAVEILKGSLNLVKGDLVAENSNTGDGTATAPYAAGVYLAAGAWAGGRPTVTMAMSDGSVTARRTNGGYGQGICCAGSGTTASAVDITGGTINALCPNGKHAVGIYAAGHSVISNVTINSSAQTLAYAVFVGPDDAKIVIDGGTYTATTTSEKPRTIVTRGNVSILGGTFAANGTTDVHCVYVSKGDVVVNAGSFAATATTGNAIALSMPNEGTYTAKVGGGTFTAIAPTEAYGVKTSNKTTLITTAGTFTATATSTSDAVKSYGLYLPANATAEVAGTTFNGITSGNAAVSGSNGNSQPKGAYGIFSLGNLSITNSTLNGQSAKTYAYGLYTTKSLTIIGSELNAITTGANGADHATAIYVNANSATVTAHNTTFNADAYTTYAYGAYVYAGNIISNSCGYTAKTRQTGVAAAANCLSRGIYNNSGTVVTLNGGSISCTGNAQYSQNAYGIYTAGSATITDVVITCSDVNTGYSLYAENSNATLTVNSGMFKGITADLRVSSPKKVTLQGGFYSKNTNITSSYIPVGYGIFDVPVDMEEKAQGYNYKIGDVDNPGIIVCKVYNSSSVLQKSYKSLEEALQFVNSNSGTAYTIVMTENYALPAGDYVLPAKAILLVPYKAEQIQPNGNNRPERTKDSYVTPTVFRKLTLTSGVNMVIYGLIEASGVQQAANTPTGLTTGKYGQIQLNEGASIYLESGSKLQAWGYVTGKGIITAKSGSSTYENFEMGDFKGGTVTSGLLNNSEKIFPITHYFIQNIEAIVYYRPGATAVTHSSIAARAGLFDSSTAIYDANNISIVGSGSGALFVMDDAVAGEDTWIKREYHSETDRIEWTLNNGASLSDLNINLGNIPLAGNMTLASANYVLPISSSMSVTMNYGTVYVLQDCYLMPGAQLNIKKEATLSVPYNNTKKAGSSLYIIDTDQWNKTFNPAQYVCVAKYSPTRIGQPRDAFKSDKTNLPDAEIIVQGNIEMDGGGYIYTTKSGANIHSTDTTAGKISFFSNIPSSTSEKFYQYTSEQKKVSNDLDYARLKNRNGSYTSIAGTPSSAQTPHSFIYTDGEWQDSYVEECFQIVNNGTGKHYYAYPSEFVEVASDTPNEDHLFIDKETESHYYIWTNDCVWWEVEPEEDGYAKCIHPDKYGVYFEYNEDNPETPYWEEKLVSVTWKNNNSNLVTYDNIGFNSAPKYLGTIPTNSGTSCIDYSWDGWVTNNADRLNQEVNVLDNENMPLAREAETTYYAHFKESPKQYYITFKDEDGKLLESKLINACTAPECSVTPSKASTATLSYIFDGWATSEGGAKIYEIDALPDVSAIATYFAHYKAVGHISFVNYNGDLLQEADIDCGIAPTFSGADPTRQNSGFWSYNFRGWRAPDGTEYAKGNALPLVSGNATYTALYTETDWTPEYTITFKDGNGKTLTTQYVRSGNTPAYTGVTPTKAEDEGHTYTFNGTWSPAIAAATADATYTAQFNVVTKQFTITFLDENGTFRQSRDLDYGTVPSYTGSALTKASTDEYTYAHDGWSATKGGAKLESLPAVSGDATYYAHFSSTKRKYTITFLAEDGVTPLTGSPKLLDYGVMVSDEGITKPTKAPTTESIFTFKWFPVLRTVTGNMTYRSTFEASLRPYDILWKSEDGTATFETDADALYGSTVSFGGSDPTKAATAQYTYTFDGWSTTIGGEKVINKGATPTVSGAVTYYAHFSATTNKYDVTFNMNGHGTAVPKQTIDYGSKVSQPTAPTETGYTFGGWYKEDAFTNAWNFGSDVVAGTTILYAKWTINSYTLTWNLAGGKVTVAGTQAPVDATGTPSGDVVYNTALVAPTVTRVGYTFSAWSPSVATNMPASATTYIAQWTPNTNTAYTVKHYKQKLDGTYAATPDDTDNLTGTTATSVTPAVKSYTGFTAPSTQTEAIAADGSLVIEYFYTRNSYTLAWSANGGDDLTGSYTSGTVKFGASITAPNEPTMTGYHFTTWSPSFTGTMPAAHTEYKAQWAPNDDTHYTVKHYQQNTANDNYTLYATENLTGTTATSVTPAVKSYTGFTAPSTQTKTIAADGSMVIEYYYTRNTYTPTWITDGNALTGDYTTSSVKYGATITAPDTPTKTGYTFSAWSPAFTGTMPAEDTEYTATWTANTNTPYTVKHYKQKLGGGYNDTPDNTDNLTGTTATSVTPAVKSYTGFTAPSTQTKTIAADGSLVIEYFYTRNKYDVVFENYDGTELQSEELEYEATPIYKGAAPTKPTDDYTYSFNGWDPVIASVSGDVTYTAQFLAGLKETGDMLDVVDWADDLSTVSLNMNGYQSAASGANWKIYANGKTYAKGNREADRTLKVDITGLTPVADGKVVIEARDNSNSVESYHAYRVPHIITANTDISSLSLDPLYGSVLYVKGGTLTVDVDVHVAAVYVNPGAKVDISTGMTLITDKFVLRTEPWTAAELVNNGTLTCDHFYYSRIVKDKTSFYQFALPFDADIDDVRLSSDVAKGYSEPMSMPYGNWLLRSYNAARRAQEGTSNDNWVDVSKDATDEIKANTGYAFWSNSNYYREYYFPVSYEKKSPFSIVAVTAYTGNAANSNPSNGGWNFIALPYTDTYVAQYAGDPAERIKISELLDDNTNYWQHIVTELKPAQPFYYQASQSGYLHFGTNFRFNVSAELNNVAAKRQAEAQHAEEQPTRTQWLQLTVQEDKTEQGAKDETNIFLSSRFSTAYESGYDVEKMSVSGSVPQVWTSIERCGSLAFAALPDDVRTIPLGLSAPQDCALRLSLVQNDWLDRLEHVWLFDAEQGYLADLLSDGFTLSASQGTTLRYSLVPEFKQTTGEENGGNGSEVTTGMSDLTDGYVLSVKIGGDGVIVLSGAPAGTTVRLYDAAGRLLASAKAQSADAADSEVSFTVPAAGVYLIYAGDKVLRVAVPK